MAKNLITINGQTYKVYTRKVYTVEMLIQNLNKIKDENKRYYIMDGAGELYKDGNNPNFGKAFPNDNRAFLDWFTFGGKKYAVEQFVFDDVSGLYYDVDGNIFNPLCSAGFDGDTIKVYLPVD